MQTLQIIASLVFVASLVACEPPVTFTEPQPESTKNLSAFPNRIQGRYSSLSDGSIVRIGNHLIERTYDFDYKIHHHQLDSAFQLVGDTAMITETGEIKTVQHDGDSLIIHMHEVDTLFLMSYDNVVRKLKGYYFLNTRFDETSWTVEKLGFTKGQLVISSISKKEDIDNLQEITETPNDTLARPMFTPTKSQFRKFV